MNLSLKKKITALVGSCFILFSIFAGPISIYADEATEEWSTVNATDQTVDFQLKDVEVSPYYDGAEHQMLAYKLEYDEVIFQKLQVELINKDTNTVVDKIDYVNPAPTTVTTAAVEKKNELLQQMTDMSKQTEPGNYKMTINYGINQKKYNGIANSVASGFSVSFSVKQRPINLITGSAAKVYDGKPLTNSEYTFNDTIEDGTPTLLAGDKLQVKLSGSQTEVGSSDNTVEEVKVLDNGGNDVTKNYKITTETGKLAVSKAVKPSGNKDNNNSSNNNDVTGNGAIGSANGPKTGDDSSMGLYLALAMISLGSIIGVAKSRKIKAARK